MDPHWTRDVSGAEVELAQRARASGLTLYGLPDEWEGVRLLGDVEWGGSTTGTVSVELCHRSSEPSPDAGSLCVSASGIGADARRGRLLLPLAWLVRRELGLQPPDDLPPEELKSWRLQPLDVLRAAGDVEESTLDLDVDRVPLLFTALSSGTVTVARAMVNDTAAETKTITVVARDWNLNEVSLATVDDVEPYLQGRRRQLEQMRERRPH